MRILQPDEREQISLLRAGTRDKKIYIRYTCILMFDDGLTYRQISHFLGIGEKTPQRAVDAYRKGGIEEVNTYHFVGNTNSLSSTQEQLLKDELNTILHVDCKSVVVFIKEQFDLDYSVSGVCKLLKRMGFVYKNTKIVPNNADPEKQKKSAESLKKLISNLPSNSAVYCLDGVHPTHNTGTCKGWIMKGQEYEMPSNSGRQRLNINGAMNVKNPTDILIDYTESVNAQSTQRLISKILSKNKNKKRIYLITDNARYYRNKELQAYLQTHHKIKWIYLPPYSPNLNLIERLWRFMKKEVIHGYYYDTFNKFKSSIEDFFDGIKNYKSELSQLMTVKFHLFNHAA